MLKSTFEGEFRYQDRISTFLMLNSNENIKIITIKNKISEGYLNILYPSTAMFQERDFGCRLIWILAENVYSLSF
jgi:hypothetical protein